MAASPMTIKLRCRSWKQLSAIYKRDLCRGALFLKAAAPPPLGAPVRVQLTLPSETLLILAGTVSAHIPPGGQGGRGPGFDLQLAAIPQSAMWVIETALAAADKAGPAAAPSPRASIEQARRRALAPPTVAPKQTRTSDRPPDPALAAESAAPAELVEIDVEADREVADAEAELIAALAQELAALRRLNPFQLLGVGYQTTDEEVRLAFGELTKRYHPDRFSRYQSIEARDHASEIFILIRDAYRRLGTAATRARTLEALRNRQATRQAERRARPVEAEAEPLRAAENPAEGPGPARHRAVDEDEIPTARKRPVRASAREASEGAPLPPPPEGPPPSPARRRLAAPLRPTEILGAEAPVTRREGASGRADLGQPRVARGGELGAAEVLLERGAYDDALAIYRRLAVRAPSDRLIRAGIDLAEGLRALAARDRLEAAQRFEAVLELDPTNERAARELAEMRRQATNERKGLLTRLLGRE